MFRSLSSWEQADPPATSTIAIDRPSRRRRRTRPRSQTIAMKRVSRAERAALAQQFPISDVEHVPRPVTRADCREQVGPCPWVACKHHLYLDINPLTGSIKINFPDLEPWELKHTCALQVAEAGALTLEQVGEITNLTRERVRQVEFVGLSKLGTVAIRAGLR
ncbi:MAG: DNA-binding protein [Deltaproteobacteria bacterium]|nr:DNA-binding protein [Deltaproteobacteria bacterium]